MRKGAAAERGVEKGVGTGAEKGSATDAVAGSARHDAETGPGGRARHVGPRISLELLVGRYLAYVLLGTGAVFAAAFTGLVLLVNRGVVLPADYGERNLDRVAAQLADAGAFDEALVPAAFRYALVSPDGTTVLATDMDDELLGRSLRVCVDLVERERTDGGDAAPARGDDRLSPSPGSSGLVERLSDGTWCALTYSLVSQWASRDARDSLPRPEDALGATVVAGFVACVVGCAVRERHVLARKMEPLVDAAARVAACDLDFEVGRSNVAQVDDVLLAMDAMRASLRDSLEAQWDAERRSREEVAALAHDLCTPLTVARGNAELLLESEGLDDADRASARAVLEAARAADEFVSQIIAASRGERAGGRAEVDVAGLCDELGACARELVGACGLDVDCSCDLSVPDGAALPRPVWDRAEVTRAASNLLSNACEHARSRVSLDVRVGPSGVGGGHDLVVRVADDGAGFSPAALAHGTERLYTDDSARTGRLGPGAHHGLGLAIADEVARAHGGTLALSNAEGSGAVATLRLPLGPRTGAA